MSKLYDAFLSDALIRPDIWNPMMASLYQYVTVPCRHRWTRRLWDRLRGEPHGKTHAFSEPIVYVSLVDQPTSEAGETVTVTWGADGVLRL